MQTRLYLCINFLIFISFILFFFSERVSLCNLGCLGTHSVDQTGLNLEISIRFWPNSKGWQNYLTEDTYIIDCDDLGVLGMTPFAN